MKNKNIKTKEIEEILERKEVRKKVLEKMLKKVNDDYEKEKTQIKEKYKK